PPSKAKPSRHKRLSNLFHRSGTAAAAVTGTRWSSEKKLVELVEPVTEVLGVGVEEKTGQPPGILKIFGGEICRGANYKSVLATRRSTAGELVREALERYGVSPSEG
ncbi:RAIN protein, partial [Syrrhaptes paradoxus]|nr:RAIN protein [Syrrhaptes paradoxus]